MNAIEFNNISKQYRLGTIGTGTISHDLNRWWAKFRGKEDPYLKIGSRNDRAEKGKDGEYVWALKDISFSVKQGDVVGIIGKNGAGKSTLLKILSRITAPTTGRIIANGRIASLLEVGTGFHPEMTGRENIYLNGSIMGMTRTEITRKLDEIVDFAGVAKYVDTPVKRYSSGMTVRLGFAIAAFLEPEILVVDEVLAVGDAEFQRKAIGKMQDVAHGEGRTVLFVSHNMAAVRKLCRTGILLEDGGISYQGKVNDVVNKYLDFNVNIKNDLIIHKIRRLNSILTISGFEINHTKMIESMISSKQKTLFIKICGKSRDEFRYHLSVFFKNNANIPMACCEEGHTFGRINTILPGDFVIEREIRLPDYLCSGDYWLDVCLSYPNQGWDLEARNCALLHIEGYQPEYGRVLPAKDCGFLCLSPK